MDSKGSDIVKDLNEKFMKIALKQAKKAYDIQEVPIGAIIVKDGKIISKAYNLREKKKDAVAHAEVIAIQKACKKLDSWRLSDCDMYVTCEPCPMCAGAIINSRMRKVFFGTFDEKSGAVSSNIRMFDKEMCNHTVDWECQCMEKECKEMIQSFFKELRNKK